MHLPPIASVTAYEPSLMYSLPLSSSPSSGSPISSLPLSSILHTLPLPPNLPSNQLEPLPGHLHPITLIHLSTTTRLVLKTAPSPHTLLLRHERHQLASEAVVLSLLAKSSLPVPRLLKHSNVAPSNLRSSGPFLLATHLPGIPYALVRPYLTRAERRGIERQISSILSIISEQTSLLFGPVALVAEGKGFRSWEEAFKAMVESVLMDAEDMLVALPYAEIRHVVKSMAGELDEVREARLVLTLGGGGNRRREGEGDDEWEELGILIDRRGNEVTGLVGLGGAFWGDGMCAVGDGGGGRCALYSIYAAITTIVTNHYRPRPDAKELDARKTLTRGLRVLAQAREPWEQGL